MRVGSKVQTSSFRSARRSEERRRLRDAAYATATDVGSNVAIVNEGPRAVERWPRRGGRLLLVALALATPSRAWADDPESSKDSPEPPMESSTSESVTPSREANGEAHAEGSTSPHPAAATAPPGAGEEEASQLVPKFATGFAMATATMQSIPAAVARNQLDYGLLGLLGVGAVGSPWEKWDYVAYLIGSIQSSAVGGTGGGVMAEQITLRFSPTKEFSVQAGWMRMPFSLAQAAVIITSMFPTRPEATHFFHTGADAGVQLGYETASGVVRVRGGVFDGLSLGFTLPQHTTRGPVSVLSIELSPLGAMKPQEADFGDTPFRFAVTGAVLYRKSNAYDPTGFKGLNVEDVRFAGAIRAGYKGFFLQGEYLQAGLSDDLSARPRIVRAAYGEASFYTAIKKKVGISPIARVEWSEHDANFFPLHVTTLHAGVAVFPSADIPDPSALRFILNYRGERRVEEFETAHGVVLSGMYRF